MPYVTHQGVRIHYRTEGDGPAVLLVHGMTQCGEDWYDCGYVAVLSRQCRLVIPDLPGHGQSDKPHGLNAYTQEKIVGALLATAEAAQVQRPIYWGFSLGALLGYSAASLHAESFGGWVLGGMDPYGVIAGSAWEARWVAPFRQGVKAFISHIEPTQGPFTPERQARLEASDAEALAALSEAALGYVSQPEAVAAIKSPALFYAGQADVRHAAVQQAAAAVPGARFASLPGLDHYPTFQRSDLVLPHVLPFLAEVASTEPSPLRERAGRG